MSFCVELGFVSIASSLFPSIRLLYSNRIEKGSKIELFERSSFSVFYVLAKLKIRDMGSKKSRFKLPG